jgi:SAM-dependent methyltransferase
MNRDYFKKYYKIEREHWWFNVRSKILMNVLRNKLKNNSNLSILNIGVATGRTSELLNDFGDVLSVEYDKETFEFCRDHLNLNIINASILNLPISKETYDLVCAFDVLEHVENDQLAWNEMVRVCKPGGFVYVSVPMFRILWSSHDIINQHVRRYSKMALFNLIDNRQGKVFNSFYFNSILSLPIFIVRISQRLFFWKKLKITSDFERLENKLLDKLFYFIFNLEASLLKWFTFPIGISYLVLWKKNYNNESK